LAKVTEGLDLSTCRGVALMDAGRTAEYAECNLGVETPFAEGGDGVSGFVTVTPISSSVPAPQREWLRAREGSFKDSPLNLVLNEGWRQMGEEDMDIAAFKLIEEEEDRTRRASRVLLLAWFLSALLLSTVKERVEIRLLIGSTRSHNISSPAVNLKE
jgi:hypothetical protein